MKTNFQSLQISAFGMKLNARKPFNYPILIIQLSVVVTSQIRHNLYHLVIVT